MGTLTEQGFVIERLDQIIAHLENGFRAIYGADINLDPDSPDGQMIGLVAQIKADIEEVADTLYQALDPDLAAGVWLEQRVAYAGLIRRRANHAYLRGKFTGLPNTFIPAHSIVEDEKRQRWLTTEPITLDNQGEAFSTLRSDLKGKFTLPADRPLKMITRVIGWEQITSVRPAEHGDDEESDFRLRQRFFKSRARPAMNSADGIVADIFQLDDVIDVDCLENYTSQIDQNGVPPHSINVIVEGGDDQAIARIIRNKKTSGTGMMGSTEVLLPNHKGVFHPYRFDRPNVIDCQVYLEVVRQQQYGAIDTDAIIQAISVMRFNIGEDVLHSRLFTPINQSNGFWVKTLLIGKRGSTLLAENITLHAREIARFNSADIEVIAL